MSLSTRRGRNRLSVDAPPRQRGLTLSLPQKRIRELAEDEKIYDLYYWEEVLQEDGDGGKVVVCKRKDANAEAFDFVLKIRSKQSLQRLRLDGMYRRVQERMLNFPSHAGVMPLVEVLEDEGFYYVVMEKADGGSFLEGLLSEFSSGIIPPMEMKRLTVAVLDAVGHVHDQGMLHRDIKPDNFVMHTEIDERSPTGTCLTPKLIDFDHAETDYCMDTPKYEKYRYGTCIYNAPEALLGEYSAQSDLYGVGASLYLIIAGKMPYNDSVYEGSDIAAVHGRMSNAQIDWSCEPWPGTPLCRDFCARLLAWDPCDRPASAAEAKQHDWLADYLAPSAP